MSGRAQDTTQQVNISKWPHTSETPLLVFLDKDFRIQGWSGEQPVFQELLSKTEKGNTLANWFDDWELIRKRLTDSPVIFTPNPTTLATHIAISRTLRLPVFVSLVSLPGALAGKAVMCLEISRREPSAIPIGPQYDQQKQQELIRLRAIFQSRLEGTFTTDCHGHITSFNHAAETITGYTAREAIGQCCYNLLKTSICQKDCIHHNTDGDSLQSFRGDTRTIHITRKNSAEVPVRVNTAPLSASNGEILGLVSSFQDISELNNLRKHIRDQYNPTHLIGRSPAIRKVLQLIQQVSNTESKVLITGESGTGKELVARAIHLYSSRHSGPFVPLNCAALVETLLESELFGHEKGAFTGAVSTKLGRLEQAKGGTLFLDEIGDIPLAAQVKLLRVLETGTFERVGGTDTKKMEARLITATNKNLDEAIRNGTFREDFFYRINIINIQIPPLRERREDIDMLADHFLKRNPVALAKGVVSIHEDARTLLNQYAWPGNIRELENVLEHAVVMTANTEIMPFHLPERIMAKSQFESTSSVEINPVHDAEINLIVSTLQKHEGNRTRTAAELGMDKSTLWRKMKRFNLKF